MLLGWHNVGKMVLSWQGADGREFSAMAQVLQQYDMIPDILKLES